MRKHGLCTNGALLRAPNFIQKWKFKVKSDNEPTQEVKDSELTEEQPLNICAATLGPCEQENAAIIMVYMWEAVYNLRIHESLLVPASLCFIHTMTPQLCGPGQVT